MLQDLTKCVKILWQGPGKIFHQGTHMNHDTNCQTAEHDGKQSKSAWVISYTSRYTMQLWNSADSNILLPLCVLSSLGRDPWRAKPGLKRRLDTKFRLTI